MPARAVTLTPPMPLSDRLDLCRTQVAGSAVVAYGDLDARLILRSSSPTPWARERLDALSAEAARHLRGSAADALAKVSGGRPRLAISMTASETRVFVTDDAGAGELLCSVGDARADVVASARAATAALRDVTGG